MKTLFLQRDTFTPKETLGVLRLDTRSWQTVERPWVPSPYGPGGMPFQSCLPNGEYVMRPRETDAKGKHWILSNPDLGIYEYEGDIPAGAYGRFLDLIHSANWVHELFGCIAPGIARVAPRAPGNPFDEWMVTSSRSHAMAELRGLLAQETEMRLIVTGLP